MSRPDPKDIPDLDLPPPRAPSPAPRSTPPLADASASTAGSLGASIELEPEDDAFGMEFERGGAIVPHAPVPASTPVRHAPRPASNLDVAYRRLDPPTRAVAIGPSLVARVGAWLVPGIVFAGVALGLGKLAHRTGGIPLTSLAPHAFDASSALQSGAIALTALAVAIALGVAGLRMTPRSYAIIGSAAALLVAALAMVTVTLVATEEQPTPPDGALLMPYVVPIALALLGLGLTRRGTLLFLEGGARIAGAVLAAAMGGSLVFAALELSALAARLP